MKKLALFILTPVVLLIIGALVIYFMFASEVKKHLIPQTQAIIKDTTNMEVSFADFDFSFKKLLKLEPTLIIKDIKVENGFQAKEVEASLYLTDLLKKKFKVKNFEIHNANLVLKQNVSGKISVEGLDSKPKKNAVTTKEKTQKRQELFEEIELKNFAIKDSTIALNLYKQKLPIYFNDFNLKLSDFILDKEQKLTTKLNLDSKLFNTQSSKISINGALGPIAADFKSLPINAEETIKLSIAEIPEALLQSNMGELIRVSDATIKSKAKITGDLLATSSGTGELELDNLIVGTSEEHNLTLNSTLPISFKLKNKYTPYLSLSTDNSSVKLKSQNNDSGELNFDADINMNLKSGFITGNSSGNLKDINVKNVIESLTDLRNLISGDFFLENYHVSFAGSNPESMFKSAKANAQLELKEGSIYILSTITKYKDIAQQVLNGLGSAIKTEKLSGKFSTFKADLKLDNKVLKVDNIDVIAEQGIAITGSGKVKDLQWLVFDIFMDVPKLEPVPLSIRGSIDKPKIYPNVKKITKEQSAQLLNSFIEAGLNALKESPSQTDTANIAADAAKTTRKKQSLGGFLKNTLKDNLKDSFLEKPQTETPVTEPASP